VPFSVRYPSNHRWAVCEVIGQRASILQCLDRPIENALGVVKLRKIGGKTGKVLSDFDPQRTRSSFLTPNDCAKFHHILFKIATAGAVTDIQTDRQTPAILLSVPCCAIAMGQIIK